MTQRRQPPPTDVRFKPFPGNADNPGEGVGVHHGSLPAVGDWAFGPPADQDGDTPPGTPNPGRSPGGSAAQISRGKRLPDSFAVTADMIAWARTHASHVDGRAEMDKFVDYWRAQPGQRGRKSDWPATWRNWMRRAQEHHTRSGSAWSAAGLAASTAPQPLTPEQTCRQHRGQRADRCRHCRAARIGAADDD